MGSQQAPSPPSPQGHKLEIPGNIYRAGEGGSHWGSGAKKPFPTCLLHSSHPQALPVPTFLTLPPPLPPDSGPPMPQASVSPRTKGLQPRPRQPWSQDSGITQGGCGRGYSLCLLPSGCSPSGGRLSQRLANPHPVPRTAALPPKLQPPGLTWPASHQARRIKPIVRAISR